MDLDQFAALTREVIRDDGLDALLPTACFPARGDVRVLEGLSDGVDVESEALAWAARHSRADEEYLVAFRAGPSSFRVVRVAGPRSESCTFDA